MGQKILTFDVILYNNVWNEHCFNGPALIYLSDDLQVVHLNEWLS